VSIVAEITQVLHRASDKDAIKAAAE